MHVDLDGPAAAATPAKASLPEAVVALGDAALHMDAEGEARDLRHLGQQPGQRVAAIGREIVGGDAADRVVGIGHVVEVVALGPEGQLEVEAAPGRLARDELQRLEIGVSLLSDSSLP